MNFYEKYKPLRNLMRRFDVIDGLIDLWVYSGHVMEESLLPSNYAVGASSSLRQEVHRLIFPWEIDMLAQELVLNASSVGDRSFKTLKHLTMAINHIRRLEDLAFQAGEESHNVLLEMHRIAHRQFPWQVPIGMAPFTRALKVFSASMVNNIVVRELGMTTRQFLLLGFAISGRLSSQYGLVSNSNYSVLGISTEVSRAFFDRISCSIAQLKEQLEEQTSYGSDWPYRWNPLEATPLVQFDRAHPERLICPIPRYLLRRMSAGIFYDLAKAEGFDNPFGASFQTYIGDVIHATCKPPKFRTLAEKPYNHGKNLKHGVDWILSDDSGHLFIECKTKRLTLMARFLTDIDALKRDVDVMAAAIVQLYKNIGDAKAGITHWKPDERPIYPLIVTLEDWYLVSPKVRDILRESLRRCLALAGIGEQVLIDHPYTIASSAEFELVSQVIEQVGILQFMTKASSAERVGWMLSSIAQSDFQSQYQSINRRLFEDDFETLRGDHSGW
jgi:hypothetical protein